MFLNSALHDMDFLSSDLNMRIGLFIKGFQIEQNINDGLIYRERPLMTSDFRGGRGRGRTCKIGGWSKIVKDRRTSFMEVSLSLLCSGYLILKRAF